MSRNLIEIADPTRDRYASLDLIPWWDRERIRKGRVLVLGAGALGNEVLKNLALLGVGHLFVVDFDRVEMSNLSRSILFRAADAGSPKAVAAAARLREINPGVRVATLDGSVTRDLGLGIYRRMDIVLACLDNRAARLAVNRACWRLGKPWIDGAIDVLMGIARIFVPPSSACYECSMTERDYQLMNLRYSCPLLRPEDLSLGRVPTTSISASIVAALQVQEAIKLLHGLDVLAGKGLYFNGQSHSLSVLTYTRRPDCYGHEIWGKVYEFPAGVGELTVGSLLERAQCLLGEPQTLLLDEEIVECLDCPRCRQSTPVFELFDQIVPTQVPCPTCRENRLPRVATRLSSRPATATIPLGQIGIPALQILRLEGASGEHSLLELSGDREHVFRAWGEGELS